MFKNIILWTENQFNQIKSGNYKIFLFKVKKCLFYLFIIFLILPAFPIFLIMRFLSKIILIRFGKIPSRRFGHFILDVDQYLCMLQKPKFPTYDFFYLEKPVSNNELVKLFGKFLKIIPSILILPFEILNNFKFIGNSKHNIILNEKEGWVTRNRYNDLNKYNYFSKKDFERGNFFLKNLGINKEDKFICLLCRDNEYIKHLYSKTYDLEYTKIGDQSTYRNCSIDNFRLICEYLTSKGYYIFRMGDKVSKPFFIKSKKFFDYSTLGMRNEFLDIFLSANCELFLTTGSGLDSTAEVFNRPRVIVSNPRIGYITTNYEKQLTIFKHFISNNKKITLSEIFNLGLAEATRNYQFISKNINLVENNPEEIRDAVIEMLELIQNNFMISDERKNIEQKFWKIFKKKISDQNLSFLHKNYLSHIGYNFLNQNTHLLI